MSGGEREVSMAHGGAAAADAEAAAGVGAGDAAVAGGDAAGGLCLGLDLCRESEDTSPCWVFWDVETCPCPLSKLDVPDMFPKIKSILRQWGFRGPVEMIAVGNAEMFSHQTAAELTNSGVTIRSFRYEECSHLASLVLGIIGAWVARKHPPANILLISDSHFLMHYNTMRERGYNVLERHQPCKSLERFVYPWNPGPGAALLQQHQRRGLWDALLQQDQRRGELPRERQNYCWSWEEVLEGRPWGSLKRSRDIGVPSVFEAKRLAL